MNMSSFKEMDPKPYQICRVNLTRKQIYFTHLAYCVQHYGYSHAVIQATDTDILVMAIYHSVRIPGLEELWVQKVRHTYFVTGLREMAEKNQMFYVFSYTSSSVWSRHEWL